jgi:hypothetical protein
MNPTVLMSIRPDFAEAISQARRPLNSAAADPPSSQGPGSSSTPRPPTRSSSGPSTSPRSTRPHRKASGGRLPSGQASAALTTSPTSTVAIRPMESKSGASAV